MNQLSKEELLNQLLGLNSSDLLEIKSALEIMEKHKISRDTINKKDISSKGSDTRNTTKINTKSDIDKQKRELEKSIIELKQDSIGQARFSEGLCCIKCGAVEGIIKNGKRKRGKGYVRVKIVHKANKYMELPENNFYQSDSVTQPIQ